VRYNVVARGRRSGAVIFSPTELDRGIEVVTGNSTRAPDFHDRCRLRDASALSWTSKKCLNIEEASPPAPCSGVGRGPPARRSTRSAKQDTRQADIPDCTRDYHILDINPQLDQRLAQISWQFAWLIERYRGIDLAPCLYAFPHFPENGARHDSPRSQSWTMMFSSDE